MNIIRVIDILGNYILVDQRKYNKYQKGNFLC